MMAGKRTQKTKSAINGSNNLDSTDSEKSQSSTVPFEETDALDKDTNQYNSMDGVRFYTDRLDAQLAIYINEVVKLREDYKTCISDGSELKAKMSSIDGYAQKIIIALFSAVIAIILFYYGVINKQFTDLQKELNATREEFIKQQLTVEVEHSVEQEKPHVQTVKSNPN